MALTIPPFTLPNRQLPPLPKLRAPQSAALVPATAPPTSVAQALLQANPSGGDFSGLIQALQQRRLQQQQSFVDTLKQAMAAKQTQPGAPGAAPAAPAGADIPPPHPALAGAAKIIATAKTQLGVPYVWGGTAWGKGLDCSGFVQQTLARNGIKVSRTTYTQFKEGIPVGKDQLQPGDVVFFRMGKNGPEHEGLYVGNDQFIEAPHTGDHVKVVKFSTYGGFAGARRFIQQ